jgi:Leucine-rich repeat (LRR) protein
MLTKLVYEFFNLEELNISRNSIFEIPASIARMAESLKTLKCEDAGLVSFPEGICELMKLQVLNLSHNKISALPSAAVKLNMLVNLRELYMNQCELRGWSQLYCQAKLRTLHLSGNQIHGIPPEVATLAMLEDLRLNKNMIAHIPDHVQNFKMLRYFDLSSNAIQEIDEHIGELTNLETLLLQNNQITELPETFSNLVSLTELNLSENKLTSIPDVSKMIKLRILEAAHNQIKALPKGIGKLSKLEKLDMTMNRIEQIPDEFYNLKSLVQLRLKHNLIEQLDGVKFGQLVELEEANFDNNALDQIPSGVVKLKKLKSFLMNYNLASPIVLPEDIKNWSIQNLVKIDCEIDAPCLVIDKLYIGSANAATSKKILQSLGITHILTSAKQIAPRFPDVSCTSNTIFTQTY